MECPRVTFVAEGKEHETVKEFKDDLEENGGDAEDITDFSLDMSRSFIKGVKEEFPKAHMTFDKFHVIKLINDPVD